MSVDARCMLGWKKPATEQLSVTQVTDYVYVLSTTSKWLHWRNNFTECHLLGHPERSFPSSYVLLLMFFSGTLRCYISELPRPNFTNIVFVLFGLSLWLIGTVRAEPETVISRTWVQSPARLNKLFQDYWRACFEINFSDRQEGLTVSSIICDR